jgi:hypothetical protein
LRYKILIFISPDLLGRIYDLGEGATLLPNGCEVTDLTTLQRVASTGQKNPAGSGWRINTLSGKIAVPDEP